MIPLLLINGVVWGYILKTARRDAIESRLGPYPSNPQYDQDMIDLYEEKDLQFNLREQTEAPDKQRKERSKRHRQQANKAYEEWSEEWMWREEIVNPSDYVYANGRLYEPLVEDEIQRFLDMTNEARVKGVYNSKNWDEGGSTDMKRDLLRMKGFTVDGANRALDAGIDPFKQEVVT